MNPSHVGKKVLMIVENNNVPFDRRVWQEARSLQDAGYDVTVIAPRTAMAGALREKIDGIRVLRHPRLIEAGKPWQYVIEYLNSTFWEIALSVYVTLFRGVDIVHIANPPDVAFIVGRLLRLFGVRVIFDQHDLSPEVYQAKFGNKNAVWRALRVCERASYKAANIVITSNETMKRAAIARGGRLPEDVFVVRNGPDIERFHPGIRAAEQRSERRDVVCYMGIIGEQEGLDIYLAVIDDVVNSHGRDAEFVIIGDGTGLAELQSLTVQRGLDRNVTFTGYLTGDALVASLGEADVCVVPEIATPLTEASTLVKTMEYMAMAKPVVQYDLPEARITSGETAVYAERNNRSDFAKKIVYLLDNPDVRHDLGTRAAARVADRLAWPHQVPNLLDAYNAALNGTGHG